MWKLKTSSPIYGHKRQFNPDTDIKHFGVFRFVFIFVKTFYVECYYGNVSFNSFSQIVQTPQFVTIKKMYLFATLRQTKGKS